MKKITWLGAIAFLLPWAIDCGGEIASSRDIGTCPSGINLTCPSGFTCTNYESVSCPPGMTVPVTCECENDQWVCPSDNISCTPSCPASIDDGEACTMAGQECPITFAPNCGGGTGECTCDGSRFSCPGRLCVASCPDPSELSEGLACNQLGLKCPAGFNVIDPCTNIDVEVDYECTNSGWTIDPTADNCDGGSSSVDATTVDAGVSSSDW